MAQKYTIIQDTSEKTPLIFPSHIVLSVGSEPPEVLPKSQSVQLDVKVAHLPTGDYCLEGLSKTCLIERKGSLSEITSNLMSSKKERTRVLSQFDRLAAETDYPILLLEGSPTSLKTPNFRAPDPELAFDNLIRELALRRIQWMLCPGYSRSIRAATGSIVARQLIHALSAAQKSF